MKKNRKNIGGLLVVILISVLPWLIFANFFYKGWISGNVKDWAEFGSYIGGTVAALTIPSTLYFIFHTYESQRETERISKLSFRNQKFESRFFEFMKVFNDYRFSQLKGWIQEGDREKQHYIGLTFFTQKRRTFQTLYTNQSFNEAFTKVLDEANLNFEFYFRCIENIIIMLEEIREESLEDNNKLLQLVINSLTNDEKFFLKYFHIYESFSHFGHLKEYQAKLTKHMVFDYKDH